METITVACKDESEEEKSGDQEILKEYLNRIVAYMEVNKSRKKQFLVLPYGKNEFVLDEEEIEYIERDKRITKIHISKDVVLTTMKMTEIKEYLNKEKFSMCHNSFIVNMEKIRVFGRKEIVLRSGGKVPVSRSHWKETKNIFGAWTKEHMTKANEIKGCI